MTKQPTLAEYGIAGACLALVSVFVTAAALAPFALLLAIQGACFTIAWNYGIVALFYCAPVAFWQGCAAMVMLRLVAAQFRPRPTTATSR